MWRVCVFLLIFFALPGLSFGSQPTDFGQGLSLERAWGFSERQIVLRTREWTELLRKTWQTQPNAQFRLGRHQYWGLSSVCPVRERCSIVRDPESQELVITQNATTDLDSWIQLGMNEEAAWRKILLGPIRLQEASNESERRLATSLERNALSRLLGEELGSADDAIAAAWVESLPEVPLHLAELTHEEFGKLIVHAQTEVTIQGQAARVMSELGRDDPEFMDWAKRLRNAENSWPRDGVRLKARFQSLRDDVLPREHLEAWTNDLIARSLAEPTRDAVIQLLMSQVVELELTTWTESWLSALIEELHSVAPADWRLALERGYNAPFLNSPAAAGKRMQPSYGPSLEHWQKWGRHLKLDTGIEPFESHWSKRILEITHALQSEAWGILRYPQIAHALENLEGELSAAKFHELQTKIRAALKSADSPDTSVESLRCAYASSARFAAVLRAHDSRLVAAREALSISCSSPSFRDRLIAKLVGWYYIPGFAPLGIWATGFLIRPLKPFMKGLNAGLAPVLRTYLRGVMIAAAIDTMAEGQNLWQQRTSLKRAQRAQMLQTGPGWLSADGIQRLDGVLAARTWGWCGKLALDSVLIYVPELFGLMKPLLLQAALARRVRALQPDIADFLRLDVEPGRWDQIWIAYQRILADPARSWTAKNEARAAVERLQMKISRRATW